MTWHPNLKGRVEREREREEEKKKKKKKKKRERARATVGQYKSLKSFILLV